VNDGTRLALPSPLRRDRIATLLTHCARVAAARCGDNEAAAEASTQERR